ncbi:MAG TPA: hypothetical protein VM095_18325 [Pyrinomonadaceae bacterium]|nr:hypothetical protein [Pyrinomonadaceae bacterium]
MEKRQIRMQDGRYLIFYTFTDAPPAVALAGDGESVSDAATKEQSAAKPEAEEEEL